VDFTVMVLVVQGVSPYLTGGVLCIGQVTADNLDLFMCRGNAKK